MKLENDISITYSIIYIIKLELFSNVYIAY